MTAVPDQTGALYVAERLLGTVREDVARADTKAAVLLSGALAMPALLFGGKWSPAHASGGWLTLLAVGGLLWATGTTLLVWTILPRTGTIRPGPDVTYFADAHHPHPATTDLLHAITTAGRDRVGWLTTQFVDMSTILAAKYRCLRWGVCFLAPGLLLCGVALAATA